MAKNDANWVELDPAQLPQEARAAYDAYKAAYRQMKAQREAFEGVMSQDVPAGKRMVFGYNFGKLSVALVDDDRKPKAAKPGAMSLAQYLAQATAQGRAS